MADSLVLPIPPSDATLDETSPGIAKAADRITATLGTGRVRPAPVVEMADPGAAGEPALQDDKRSGWR